MWGTRLTKRLAATGTLLNRAAHEVGHVNEEYRKSRLALEQARMQVEDIQNQLHTTTTIAQQFFVVDIAIVGIMAAAAIGVEQINLALTQLYQQHVPATDAALTRGGLIAISTFTLFTIGSAALAAACFLGETTELGPGQGDFPKDFSAIEQNLTEALVWRTARDKAVSRLRTADGKLRAAVGVLVLGVVAGLVAGLPVWY